MSFAFDPDQPVGRNLAHEYAAQLSAALEIVRNGEMPAARRIHEARTCCKRARGVLRIVDTAFPAYREENAAIRDAAAGLSRARDIDSLRLTLGLVTDRPGAFATAEVGWLTAAIGGGAETSAADESAALDRFAAAIEPILVRTRLWHTGALDWDAVAAGAARTYRRARRAMRRAERTLAAADFHEWRKHAKYHWYHLRLLRRFDADRFRPARDRARHLARLLGAHHDLDVLAAHVAARSAADSGLAGAFVEAVRNRQDALAADALTLGVDLFGQKPRGWRERLASQLAATAAGSCDAPAESPQGA